MTAVPPTSTTLPRVAGDLVFPLDGAACAQLVAGHGPMVQAACARLLRDAALAEDAAQEVFVRFVQKAPQMPAQTVLGGWLYQTATHVARTHLRTHLRRRAREAQPEALENLMPTAPPEPWKEIEPLLEDAMLTLPTRQRDLVLLCYFEKTSQRDAARALGCSESAASRDLAGAIETLRGFFTRRGVSVPGSALIALLGAHAAQGALAASAVATITAAMIGSASTAATATALTLMTTTAKVLTGTAALTLVCGVAYLTTRETSPSPVPAPAVVTSTPAPETAAPAPVATSSPALPPRMAVQEWIERFRALHGLARAELGERLAALGFPLSERTLDALLKKAPGAEQFAEMLLEQLMLFHPTRLLADAMKRGLPNADVWQLVEGTRSAWQRRRLESWAPPPHLIDMMRSHFAGDEKSLEALTRIRRPYGNPLDADPLALGAKLLATPAAQRKEEQVMTLALGWPPDRAHEMAAWGAANLQGKERVDFFARIAYPAYQSGDPDLALRLLHGIGDPADRALVAPMVAATLMQHDRTEEALAVVAQLEGSARLESVKMAAKHWALRDPDAAIAWANELPANEFNTALNGMFEHLPAPTMRTALDHFAKGPVDPAQDAAILRGLSRTTSWTDTATAADVIPGYYAARGFAPLAAPTAEMWKGTPEQQSAALQFDVAARTVWSLSQKNGGATALEWADRVQWATPDDKLIAQAYALPETVEIYQKHSVLGPIRGWINQQLADPAKRTALATRLAELRTAK